MGDPYTDLFFGGDDHPRHGCKMIGSTAPRNKRDVFFSFDTRTLATDADATTTVSNAAFSLTARLTMWSF